MDFVYFNILVYPDVVNRINGFVEVEPDHQKTSFCNKEIFPAKSVIYKETGFILAMTEKTMGGGGSF